MATFFRNTIDRIRQPLACLGAITAGCLVTTQLGNLDLAAQESMQNSVLADLLNQESVQITPMPPVEMRGMPTDFSPLAPLRSDRASSARLLRANSSLQPIRQSGTSGTNPQSNSAADAGAASIQQLLNSAALAPSATAANADAVTAEWQSPRGSQTASQHQMLAAQTSFQQSPTKATSVLTPAVKVASLEAPATTYGAESRGLHQLQNLSISEFESELVSTCGNRLRASSSTDGRYVRVELPNKSGLQLGMLIDRQTQLISFEGDASLQHSWHRLISNLDSQPVRQNDGSWLDVAMVDSGKAEPAKIRQVAFLMGLETGNQESVTLPPGTPRPQQDELQPGGQGATQGLKNKVKIVEDPVTGFITLVGDKADIDIVRKIIMDLAAESEAAKPEVARITLSNIQSQAYEEQIQELYDGSYASSTGPAQINAIASPNALIVVGQPKAIEAVRKIVAEMDIESDDTLDGSKSFRLKYISASDAKNRLDLFFGQLQQNQGDNTLPSAPIVTIADYRTNIITIKGSKQFISEAEKYLKEIDITDTAAASVVRVIPIKNALAEDIAIVIQDAINGQQPNAGQGFNPNQQAQQQQQNVGQDIRPEESHLRSQSLTLTTVGEDGKVISSGILFDVRVTADRNSNSLVVTAPAESIDLVVELVKQLDRVPNAETQIKVFRVANGDAAELLATLEALFASNQQQQGGGGVGGNTTNLSQLPLQQVSATDGSSLINLRFAIDARTNSIIASGPAGDLQVVEDLLNRLDEQAYNDYDVVVHRLSNAPVLDVEEAINAWLDSRADILTNDPRAVGGLNQATRQVIVTSEVVSNSLIIQARPDYMGQILQIIEALDRRPPMVKVKVMIVEVDLSRIEEFGVELGVQDSLLFDRGTAITGGQITSGGFPFTSPASANNTNPIFPGTLAGQALSTFGTGSNNADLGYGGMVLSAANESISILIRALEDNKCARVLSKPHIMTMENLQGRVTIGSEVPRVAGSTNTVSGVTQNVEFVDVGVILEVTPRVSPDGMIVMAVDAKKSRVTDEGITIGAADGVPIISPIIDETEANTTLMARSGQTVVFSGLIQEDKFHVKRGVPILSDLPYVGPLFAFESDEARRSELLIIMTPYLITDDQSLDAQNYDEMERMHWCLSDVVEVYGDTSYDGFGGSNSAVQTYYPDSDPTGMNPQMYQQNVIDNGNPGQMVPEMPQPRN